MSEQKSVKMLGDLMQAMNNIETASHIRNADMDDVHEELFSKVCKDYGVERISWQEKDLKLHFKDGVKLTYAARIEVYNALQKKFNGRARVGVDDHFTKVEFPGKYLMYFSRPYINAYEHALDIKKDLIMDQKQHEAVANVIDTFGYLSASK